MPQVHFSVDEQTAKRLASEAKRRGLSLSRYLAELVTRELPETWPQGYLAGVVGACRRDPMSEPVDLPLDDLEIGPGNR